ncbi:MAG: glycosyltransferase [Elusimicrobia bacterium]|nr:glycosyltransferase [Elusimicrobiota bacterium]
MAPRISVIVDNYNYGRFLGQALDSVLAQDHSDWECVVVDDGSTDESRSVIERFSPRVRGIFQKNSGYAAAFNRGISETTGDIVCFLDADDVWRKDKLSRIAARFESEPDLGGIQHLLQDADTNLISMKQDFPAWPLRYTLDDFLAGKVVLGATSGVSLRRCILNKALPIPTEFRFLYADNYLLVRSLFFAPLGNISESLGYHRVHGSNFCAGTYADPRKLGADMTMGAVYETHLRSWLRERGASLSPEHERVEGLERMRREVLWHSLEHRRGEAAAALWRGARRHGFSRFGLFRVATCAIAVISPSAYLSLYESYAGSSGLRTLRHGMARA